MGKRIIHEEEQSVVSGERQSNRHLSAEIFGRRNQILMHHCMQARLLLLPSLTARPTKSSLYGDQIKVPVSKLQLSDRQPASEGGDEEVWRMRRPATSVNVKGNGRTQAALQDRYSRASVSVAYDRPIHVHELTTLRQLDSALSSPCIHEAVSKFPGLFT